MSFRISWDAERIITELRQAYAQASSPYSDGFNAWGCKKDLLEVKYALDYMIEQLPNFSHLEAEYHEEKAKQTTWRTLNGRV